MTRQEIIDSIQIKADLPSRAVAEKTLDAIQESIAEELAAGRSVLIRGFGSFQVRDVAARKGRDFKTNQAMDIPAGRTVKFEPGAELRKSVLSGKAESYVKSMQGRLEGLRAGLEDWGKRTECLGADAREYCRANMGRLKGSYEELRYKLTLLQGSSGGAWTELRRGIDSAFKELKAAFTRAREKF